MSNKMLTLMRVGAFVLSAAGSILSTILAYEDSRKVFDKMNSKEN